MVDPIRAKSNQTIPVDQSHVEARFKVPKHKLPAKHNIEEEPVPPPRIWPGAKASTWSLDMLPGISRALKMEAIRNTDPDVRNYAIKIFEMGRGPAGGRFKESATNDFVTITFPEGKSTEIEYHPAGIEHIRNARHERGEPEMREGDPTDPVWNSTQTHPKQKARSGYLARHF
jgi:hypothetical protein